MKILQLRPQKFKDFVGQEKIIITLKTMIEGAQHRKESLDHIIFSGPPGTGKTTLATIIANEMNSKIHYIQGSLLEKKSDILSVFANVNENDIIFIDEIHSINKSVEELIYNAMEDFKIDIILGVEGNSKVMRMNLKHFTLIGATTKINLLSQPFRDRFGFNATFDKYHDEDLVKILKNNIKKMKLKVDDEAIKLISLYSRSTPRIANNLLKRCADFSLTEKCEKITKTVVLKTFKYLELYDYGLGKNHINYLDLLNESFNEK
ncbi:UNVERIFIED_CONTAM: Holliday junction branch migration DNA helicase RuvB [Campylobacter lari]